MKQKKLSSNDALKRSSTAPSVVVIGPSTSGKSTLVYLLVNHKIIGYISIGIGDKSQTTIIPCDFVFDSRIEKNEQFAICVKTKEFDSKAVHIIVLEKLTQLYVSNGADMEDTVESINAEWLYSVLEPEEASFHLGKLADSISIDAFKEAMEKIFEAFEMVEPSFSSRVKMKKKELSQQKISISEVRKIVFEEVWNEIEPELKVDYIEWLEGIGDLIETQLKDLLGEKLQDENILELSVDEHDDLQYGGNVLQNLFDPFQPYSLIINDLTLSCRPREEIIKMGEESIPTRFCLRDTMGLTQVGMDSVSIKNALDVALNCSPDSILLLLSLEERDDILAESCKAIKDKLLKAKKMDIPINVIFTKADRIIGNKIYKKKNSRNDSNVELSQEDYDGHVLEVITEVEMDIKRYLEGISSQSVNWLSLRYLEEKIDPVQKALRNNMDDRIDNFKPIGLYKVIDYIAKDTQKRILPDGITKPIFVTANEPNFPAVKIALGKEKMSDVLDNMKYRLTKDVEIVNGYQIRTEYTINGRSVTTYWRKLQIGLGHTTRARVYGNFSINMKAMLRKVLNENIPHMMSLYENQAIETVVGNLCTEELHNLIEQLDSEDKYKAIAFDDINPVLIKAMSDDERYMQILHVIFKDYFMKSGKYYMVIDKVAFKLSYGNNEIKKHLAKIYNKPLGYDETMRMLQESFLKIFTSQKFDYIVLEEIGNAMTDIVNKMFITI
ncbi:hypothetical protein QBE53_12565 [Vallitaleaceae bacterium 9-2]